MRQDGNSLNTSFIEALYAEFLADPASVPGDWRSYFDGLAPARGARPVRTRAEGALGARRGNGNGAVLQRPTPARDGNASARQHAVDQLIRNYRVRGHIIAHLDPLGMPRPAPPELDPAFCGLTEEDLDREFSTTSVPGPHLQTLRRILDRMRNTYCRSIGAQFMHIDDLAVRQWLQERMEGAENRILLPRKTQLRILKNLMRAVTFEQFIQKKYLGAKSFSLEGAESLIPLMELAIDKASEQGVDEIVIGMAHRGRLNVLANVIGKRPQEIFYEFEDRNPFDRLGAGDVKYHLGYSTDVTTHAGRRLHLSLCFNPSHLEYINPVAMGRLRAKQDRVGDADRARGMVLLIHGDAAFAGEGVVQETLNMSALPAYSVGGTVHVIVNNQIGFTTRPEVGRSSVYATGVAKMLQAPIFHVNGEDPEAVAQVVNLALEFRRQFRSDVFIDMYCYRRRGHNEADEPAFTQPLLYHAIERRKPVGETYLDHLVELGGVSREQAKKLNEAYTTDLERALDEARSEAYRPAAPTPSAIWRGYRGGREDEVEDSSTGFEESRLAALLGALARVPEDFRPHPKIRRWLEARVKMAAGETPLDWAAGEALALASLAVSGTCVRLTGQDCERGTFSQRHAVLHDIEDGQTYMSLAHLAPDQAEVFIANSPLSEAGVMGFEYGYSLDSPDVLVGWEAQFGDFCNAAQVIIDQFIASAEDKWRRLSGLVLLLPHGFEGMGPEHSSARLERWLTLAAEDNFQVVYPTTPAQYFHVLRRQIVRPLRKPLIVMTPKSLLRHKDAVSTLADCAQGRFRRVIGDARAEANSKNTITRVLLCTGKIYYELAEHRDKSGCEDVAIVRMEQLYPTPLEPLREALSPYADGTPVFWVQEEPWNMGAWPRLGAVFGAKLFNRLPIAAVTRPESASPATGSRACHDLEQHQLIAEAFGESKPY